jgi:8-oxo-dGTP pyrophosphatase MutT (NUDIX family)
LKDQNASLLLTLYKIGYNDNRTRISRKKRKEPMAVQARPAATVMLLRNHPTYHLEVFMVRRVVQSEFMPDIYVFPGGSVSRDDQLVETTPGLCASIETTPADPEGRTMLGTGVRAAAIRELFEEANVLLAYRRHQFLAISQESAPRFAAYRQEFNQRNGSLLTLAHDEQLIFATDHLRYFSHWITPEDLPRRYDTHFFLAIAPDEQEALYDQLETSEGLWIAPSLALERYAAGTFPLAFPTYRQLRDLCTFANIQEAIATTRYVQTHLPRIDTQNGEPRIYLPEDAEHSWPLH